MEKGANSVCFLTSVMGEFAGLGEQVEIVDQQGFWILRGHQGTHRAGLKATAICIGSPN